MLFLALRSIFLGFFIMSDFLCPFDSYPCFRDGYCISRFFYPEVCSRYVRIRNNRFSSRLVKKVVVGE